MGGPVGDASQFMSKFIYSGVFDRFPGLQMVAVECGVGWVPHFLEHMDDHYWRNRTWTKSTLKLLPSEYFRRNWKVTFIREPFAVAVRHWIGVGNLMWSTDYPHHRHDWPYSRRIVEESMGRRARRGAPADGVRQRPRAVPAGYGEGRLCRRHHGGRITFRRVIQVLRTTQHLGQKEGTAMGLLDGKVAIVTGAGHGIGRGEALELARQGAKVVVNDVGGSVHGEGEDKRPAEEVAELIRSRGGEAAANYDDVADWAGAQPMVTQAVDEFGRLDVLVNNAGIVRDAMLFSMTEDDFDAVVRVHLKGTFATTHHAGAYWREESKAGRQPRSAIVNTVSSAGLQGNVGQANYGAAKAGIAVLTVISSLELSRYGVRANAVAPGGMTRITATLRKDAEVSEPDEPTTRSTTR